MTLFIAFSLIHLGFFSWLLYHWKRLKVEVPESQEPFNCFSVIIPIRNEADNILDLLCDLKDQSYPCDNFEVIIIDDHSEDDGPKLCADYFSQETLNGRVISLNSTRGKKEAITAGVANAGFEIILTTDADCRVSRQWISSYNEGYCRSDLKMLTGPVRMWDGSLFQKIQQYEFGALIGIGAASLSAGHPGMCNGANLSYKRHAFLEVGGYHGNEHIPSGDDEFLLQKLYGSFPGGVGFLKNRNAVVTTSAKSSLRELINQRIRWASKWKFHKSWFIRIMAIAFFVNYLVLITTFLLSFRSLEWMLGFLGIFLIRWLIVFIFAGSVLRFLGVKRLFFPSFLGEIFYPLFVTFLGLASIFGKYSWKGRNYQ